MHRHVEHVMGTAVSFDFRSPTSPRWLEEAVAWLHHVDGTYSTYDRDTPISQLGLGLVARADLSDEVNEVLDLCEHLRAKSDGTFDAWSVPAPNGSTFDPSGVVKGWAIERAAQLLEAHGATNFCINAGGDIALRGTVEAGALWRIGIRHPDLSDRMAFVLEAGGPMGVATSAAYERGEHIMDPRLGSPARTCRSVTVIGPDLTLADAYATIVFVKGRDGLLWLKQQDVSYEGFVITPQDTTIATHGFRRFIAP